uniref:nuclear GTPase SLIP-GC-like isoform X2 n=1 Tax=Monopterus albus TaxID=43700 RepID=UPI0009B4A09E|nr:nuclear GTPase SLIP-GC-like isoform X2 [Monopterus albus]
MSARGVKPYASSVATVQPSSSEAVDKGKRKLDHQGESSTSPSKRQPSTIHGSLSEEILLSHVQDIMRSVGEKLHNQGNKRLIAFLKTKIKDFKTDKKELVGVFGRSGAGKSSLINAIIGEKDLLPTGDVSACTSVMIKVETNMDNQEYEAEIEFITKEEWKDELQPLYHILGDDTDQEQDDDEDDGEDDEDDGTAEKLSALYGEDIGRNWKNTRFENLMDNKHFEEIPEFLKSQRKILTCKSAEELSAEFVKYTRSDRKGEGEELKRWYWPLVKCVTIRVPKNDLLQHVTLVDLPGTGDCNKGRDKMWKKLVGSCSTVWIVSDINRAASENDPWEILKSACRLIGNGGECQRIHFICTKSDVLGGR